MKSYKMFIQWAQETIEVTLMVSAVFTVVSLFLHGPGTVKGTLEYIETLFPVYILVFSIFVLPVMMGSIYQTYIPLGISLGCSRQKSFRGCVMLQFAACMETVLLVLILQAIFGWKTFEGDAGQGLRFLGVAFLWYMTAAALGQLLGMIYLRYGKIGMILSTLFFAVCGGGTGVVISMTLKDKVAIMTYTNMIFEVGIVLAIVVCVGTGLFIRRQMYRI